MKDLKALKKAIKEGKYDLNKAIKSAADKIASNPEVLLWR